MTDRTGVFAGDDPFAIARDWLDEARGSEPSDPDAAALASVDAQGMPNVRVVLMRQIRDDGFVFFTNYDSAKGQELQGAGKAAFVIHWKSLRRQIRVRGDVTRAADSVSDAYYAQRDLQSRIGAYASIQSQPLEDRALLMDRVARLGAELGDDPARPPNWGGFHIAPLEIEFWADGAHRLHDRFRWTRPDCNSPWDVHRLFP